MYQGKTVFSQITDSIPMHRFRKCVGRYNGNKGTRSFSCSDQFLCMAFAQLTYRESLRDIECCLRSVPEKLCHMGIKGNISRSTPAEANENRNRRICSDFAQVLIHTARSLYADEPSDPDLNETVYASDASATDLCLSLFPWAKFRKTKAAIKLRTLSDLRGNIPSFISITDGKVHDVNISDELIPETGAIYVTDRGYPDFSRLYYIHQYSAFFVTGFKTDTKFERLYSHKIDKSTGVMCDQTVALTGVRSKNEYPEKLRRIKYIHIENQKRFNFMTDQFSLPSLTIAELYKNRWNAELFFKRIKQHLRIKAFYGTSENAVKTQIWIAISVYVLVAIIKKQLNSEQSLYTILQVLSVTLFEKKTLYQIFNFTSYRKDITSNFIRSELFNI